MNDCQNRQKQRVDKRSKQMSMVLKKQQLRFDSCLNIPSTANLLLLSQYVVNSLIRCRLKLLNFVPSPTADTSIRVFRI